MVATAARVAIIALSICFAFSKFMEWLTCASILGSATPIQAERPAVTIEAVVALVLRS